MSTIAVVCGLIIFALLAVMLLSGVPIAVALAVSSIVAGIYYRLHQREKYCSVRPLSNQRIYPAFEVSKTVRPL